MALANHIQRCAGLTGGPSSALTLVLLALLVSPIAQAVQPTPAGATDDGPAPLTRRQHNEALLDAVLAGDLAGVREQLAGGASPSARDAVGRAALMLAVTGGHEVEERVLQEGFGTRVELVGLPAPPVTPVQSAIIAQLVDAGADVDAPDREGRTALHYAAERDYDALVRQLVTAGARADTPFPSGLPASCLVASRGFADTLRVLHEAGVDVNAANRKTGKRPVHYAAEGDHVVAVGVLLDVGADVNSATSRGWTPLHIAAAGGQLSLTRLLLARGAERQALTGRGLSALDVARARGHAEVAVLLEASSS